MSIEHTPLGDTDSRLIPLYTQLIADDRNLVEEVRDRLSGALLADEIAPALVGLTGTLDRLQGRLDCLEFGLDYLTDGLEDSELMSFLDQRLIDQIADGFNVNQIRGFASAITDTQTELLAP
ncbi:hypothetical protein M3G04_17085 [Dietzia cinnamea]|uniref:hypothetical protein n=1 Tax=Dietzia cinnamea TaxID=321318 RepID=UPI00223A9168|nr:hypothetical protein [Dietzia cinnamea]MCT2302588.1 hypothetical protein [Dietzia cinnamea]